MPTTRKSAPVVHRLSRRIENSCWSVSQPRSISEGRLSVPVFFNLALKFSAARPPRAADDRLNMTRYRFFAIVSLVVLVFDQATKLHIDHHFRLYESMPIIPGLLSLTYIRNQGAAFGIFADSSLRLPFFIGVSLVAMLGIVWFLKQWENGQQPGNLGLALVFAGALGNLIDRIRLGEVIDFVDVYWRQYHWPAFNVADSAITVGVFLLLLEMWIERKNEQPE